VWGATGVYIVGVGDLSKREVSRWVMQAQARNKDKKERGKRRRKRRSPPVRGERGESKLGKFKRG